MSKPSARGPQLKTALGIGYHRALMFRAFDEADQDFYPGVLKAVTRTKRAAAGRSLGRAPGKMPGTPNWRAARRKAARQLVGVVEQLQEAEHIAERVLDAVEAEVTGR